MRFTLKDSLWIMALVAAVCALVMQQRRWNETRAALARYETAQIRTSLPADKFRVIARTVLDTDHVKVLSYRIETAEEHFATIKSGRDSNGCRSEFDPQTNLHVCEAIVLFDHVKSDNRIKMMAKVGGAQGYTEAKVAEGYSLSDAVTINEVDRLYSRDEAIELYEWDGKGYILVLK